MQRAEVQANRILKISENAPIFKKQVAINLSKDEPEGDNHTLNLLLVLRFANTFIWRFMCLFILLHPYHMSFQLCLPSDVSSPLFIFTSSTCVSSVFFSVQVRWLCFVFRLRKHIVTC